MTRAAETSASAESEMDREARDEVEAKSLVGAGEGIGAGESKSKGEGVGNGLSGEGKEGEEKGEEKKPSRFKQVVDKLGLDLPTLMLMFKGSLAPLIGIAFYQSTSVAKEFSTLGYLVPIITVLNVPIMPRAKFLQTLVLNVVGICIGSAVALLGIWSGVQARIHTTPAGSTAFYNSSQAAVCAIWLFANIWFVNVLRAKIPALQFPVIMYSIFTNVAFTYGPLFPTIVAGEALIKQLLTGFLTAFAISAGVSLFIIPVSSRTVVFKEAAGYVQTIQATLKAQTAYLQSLETSDMFSPGPSTDEPVESKSKSKDKRKDATAHPARNEKAIALKANLTALTSLHGKLQGDLPFGKREFAWGKLDPKDLDEIFVLFRGILIPLIGMSTITDIFERIAERRGWVNVKGSKFDDAEAEPWEKCGAAEREEEKKTWNEIMKALHEPFEVMTSAMDGGLTHAGLVLELLPKPKQKKGEDVEAKGDGSPKPGDPEFSADLERKIKEFYGKRGQTLKAWARQKGLSEDQFDSANVPAVGGEYTVDEAKHRRDQSQLYLILYLEHLLYSCGLAISNLIKFADKRAADGKMKNHLIVPGQRRLWKWIKNLGQEDATIDTESPDSLEAGANTVYLGAGFNPKKDPEHLPPRNAWEKFGNGLRSISHFLGSAESAFGFRVAVGCSSVLAGMRLNPGSGIIAFLKDSQLFFIEQRLVWAMIIIAIGMTITSGQSIFGFFGRIAGTVIAMICSYVIWYIADQKTAGVIVMLWFFIFCQMYFFLKYPRFIAIFLVSIVTEVLIIGYELQVRKIGIKASAATGQPYYPTYKLAPYRLACVAGGSFVAFIWTIFPYPLSDRSWIRKDLGTTLYLLANYYSVVHATIGARMHNTEGDMSLKTSPGRKLEKARHRTFGKMLLLLPSLQQHADWQKWELSIGGKFPRETYEGITARATNIMHYLSLMSYATQSWSAQSTEEFPNTIPSHRRQWISDLSALIDSVGATSHAVTSILSLLSASVRQGSALPPYIQLPQPYNLSRRLEALDKGILDARHVEEPGYSAYAVLQVCSSMVTDDLRRLVEHVKDLVGETDFTFRVDASQSSVDSTGSERSGNGKGKVE